MKDAKIRIRRLNFWYADKQTLFEVNLDIYRNRITAFIGPSGCGKSTLLRCINRMNDVISIARMEGSIQCSRGDLYAQDAVEVRKRIGMVFQKPNPFPM